MPAIRVRIRVSSTMEEAPTVYAMAVLLHDFGAVADSTQIGGTWQVNPDTAANGHGGSSNYMSFTFDNLAIPERGRFKIQISCMSSDPGAGDLCEDTAVTDEIEVF